MPQPKPGTTILERYVIDRPIARGGMSSIWTASDRKLRRAVAVKILASSLAREDEIRDRFEREAMAVAQLQSPHVVQIFDYGVDGGHPVIVMELLQGEDLRDRLKRCTRLPLPAIVDIVDQCARGLGEAHAAGIVHRDLKPGNVFLARGRQHEVLKLLDFGVAKAGDQWRSNGETTSAGQILGTPNYMSPEQARAQPVDHRTDLWSLGVIIYQMMSGQLPFKGPSPHHVILAVAKDDFHPLSLYAPDAPPGIDDFIARALCRDPQGRFASAAEMAEAFGRLFGATTTTAHVALPPIPTRPADAASLEMPSSPTAPSYPSVSSLPSAPSQLSWPTSPSAPSFPTAPSYPSQGTLGSAMLPAPRPKKRKTSPWLILWAAALVVVGSASVVAAIVIWQQPRVGAAGAARSEPAPDEAPPTEEASADRPPEELAAEEPPASESTSDEATSGTEAAGGNAAEDGEGPAEDGEGPDQEADGPTETDAAAETDDGSGGASTESEEPEPVAAPPGPQPVFKPVPKPTPDPYGSRF